ncbi:phage minor head protein [Treponema pedis]|uniref:phage minor head protein n=1 Tax=Treponema pedis TaxID=409322 RepID=UPI0031420B38
MKKVLQNAAPRLFEDIQQKKEAAVFYSDENKELITLAETVIKGSLLLGYLHAMPSDRKKDFADDDASITLSGAFGVEALPFEEAVQFLRSKIPMTKEEWSDLERKLQFRAFTVAKLSEADYIEAVKGRLTSAVEKGETVWQSWNDIEAMTKDWGEKFSARYWETVYRTNVQSAYNAGRLMQYQNNPPPAWELLFIEDDRTSDICKGIASLVGNGKALAASHSFWSTYGFPPYHFNCRTTFRAVYDYEIGHGTEIENVSMKEFRKHFKPQKGFGGNPIEKESWWLLTDSMKKRIEKYGLKEEVEKTAKMAGIDNFDLRLVNGEKLIENYDSGFVLHKIDGAKPKPHEIEIAEILHGYNEEFLFTPENNFVEVKNPEGIAIKQNKIAEMKEITSDKIRKIGDRIQEASGQNAQIVILHLKGKKTYSLKEATEQAHRELNTDKNILQEVWLIFNGRLSKIKK